MLAAYLIFFFFFQAEDGIRDYKVTGVQTCALPIYTRDVAPAYQFRYKSDTSRRFWDLFRLAIPCSYIRGSPGKKGRLVSAANRAVAHMILLRFCSSINQSCALNIAG